MRITCPNCKKRGHYSPPAITCGNRMTVSGIPTGETLEIDNWQATTMRAECGRCGHSWQVWPGSSGPIGSPGPAETKPDGPENTK